MNIDDVPLDDDLLRLARPLRGLGGKLRAHAWQEYGRVNPFVEDLFDWKEKGQFVRGMDVTIYESSTVVGDVTIGDHTWVGPFCLLDGSGSLSIGSYCSISTGCQILTHDTIRWAVSGGRAPSESSGTFPSSRASSTGGARFAPLWATYAGTSSRPRGKSHTGRAIDKSVAKPNIGG